MVAASPDAFRTERIERGRRLGAVTFERRERLGSRDRVLHQVRREEIPLFVMVGALEERLADSLRDAAVNLSLDQERVQHAPAIVHAEEP